MEPMGSEGDNHLSSWATIAAFSISAHSFLAVPDKNLTRKGQHEGDPEGFDRSSCNRTPPKCIPSSWEGWQFIGERGVLPKNKCCKNMLHLTAICRPRFSCATVHARNYALKRMPQPEHFVQSLTARKEEPRSTPGGRGWDECRREASACLVRYICHGSSPVCVLLKWL